MVSYSSVGDGAAVSPKVWCCAYLALCGVQEYARETGNEVQRTKNCNVGIISDCEWYQFLLWCGNLERTKEMDGPRSLRSARMHGGHTEWLANDQKFLKWWKCKMLSVKMLSVKMLSDMDVGDRWFLSKCNVGCCDLQVTDLADCRVLTLNGFETSANMRTLDKVEWGVSGVGNGTRWSQQKVGDVVISIMRVERMQRRHSEEGEVEWKYRQWGYLEMRS